MGFWCSLMIEILINEWGFSVYFLYYSVYSKRRDDICKESFFFSVLLEGYER